MGIEGVHGAGGRDEREGRGPAWRERLGAIDAASAAGSAESIGELQLPPQDDLTRHPTVDPDCLLVRARLRDHVDGDLSDRVRRAIDEHVHICRDCALALSRIELESLRLRRALREEREAAAAIPSGFVAGVMRAVGEEVLSAPSVDDQLEGSLADASGAPANFTRGVMRRVQREYSKSGSVRWVAAPSGWSRLRGASRVALLAVPVAVLAFLVARWAAPAATPEAYAEVMMAHGVARPGAGSLANGDRLDEPQVVEVEPSGELRLRWQPAGSADLPPRSDAGRTGATVYGGSIARIGAEPVVEMRRGDLQWEVPAGVDTLSLASALRLGVRDLAVVEVEADAARGAGWLSLERIRRDDSAGGGASVWRVRIEVLAGAVSVDRQGRRQRVAAGMVAHFDAIGPLLVEPAATAALLEDSRAGVGRFPVGSVASGPEGAATTVGGRWRGRVLRAEDRQPLAGAKVEVVLPGRSEPEVLRTSWDGRFELRVDEELPVEAVALVGASPPGDLGGSLRGLRPRVVSLQPARLGAGVVGDLGEFLLVADAPVRGRVVDEFGVAVAQARVVPMVVDELFGVVERLEGSIAKCDEDGGFALRGLPDSLGARESLAAVVEVDERPLCAALLAADPQRRSAAGELRMQLAASRSLRVIGWQPGGSALVLESLPGVAVQCLAVVHQGVAQADGGLDIRCRTGGTLYRFDPATGEARPLRVTAGAGSPLGPDTEVVAVQLGSRLRTRGAPLVGSAADVRVATARSGSRWTRVHAQGVRGGGDLQWLSLHDASRPVLPKARLFVQYADGSVALVGELEGFGSLPFPLPQERPFRLVAVGVDGSLGVVEVDGSVDRLPPVDLQPSGSVDLGGVGAEVAASGTSGAAEVLCRFEPLDGPLSGQGFWRRISTGGGGGVADGLPAGRYRISLLDGRHWQCEVPAGTSVRLQADAALGR